MFPIIQKPFFHKMIIYYNFPSSNEWLQNDWAYNQFKSEITHKVKRVAMQQLSGLQLNTWCGFYFEWYMKDERKDPPNIWMNQKAIFDGLVNAKVIPDDTFSFTKGGRLDHTAIDANNPRLELYIYPEVMMNVGAKAIHRTLLAQSIEA
ncbi:MAG: hypothetical protein ACPGXZ_17125 [Saprospiraceae bacterium]